MTDRPIMDAGPGLNFFATNSERLLFGTIGALSIPETVDSEIARKVASDRRFTVAGSVRSRLSSKYLEVLSDEATDELTSAVTRISGTPFSERVRFRPDLGETMVIAHAAIAAEAGSDVIVLIDDGQGRRMAMQESRRLARLRSAGTPVGTIGLIGTLTVLERAAGGTHLPDKRSMRDLYRRLRELDDGLPPVDATSLLAPRVWNRP